MTRREEVERERQLYREEKQKRAEARERQKQREKQFQKNIKEEREGQKELHEKNADCSATLIDKYDEDYRSALNSIETEVKQLIENGKEMKGLILLSENLSKILEIHDSLSAFYSTIYVNIDVLEKFNSERLRQLGYKPVALYEQLKDAFIQSSQSSALDAYILDSLKKVGFHKNHWLINPRILTEIEYLVDVLRILIEPDFIPLENKENKDEAYLDRYVPSAVKLAVWRRDSGKCVECGSKEKLEYDHIIPVSKGGSNTERNIQLLCEACNRQKAASIQ